MTFALKFTLCVLAAIAAFLWVLHTALILSCNKNSELSGRPTKVVNDTCYFQDTDGQWYDWARWERERAAGAGGTPK